MTETLKMDGHEFRSGCSITRSMEIWGDKWTLLITRDLMWHGKHTFKSLQESDENIPTNILSERLQRLMNWGLLRRDPYQERPVRYTYELSEAGRTLEPVLLEIMKWGHRYLGGGSYNPETGISVGPSTSLR